MTTSRRHLIAVRNVSGLLKVLSYAPGAWWHCFRDESGLFQARAYWTDLAGRQHRRFGEERASMVEATEELEWQLRREVAVMHDFSTPRISA